MRQRFGNPVLSQAMALDRHRDISFAVDITGIYVARHEWDWSGKTRRKFSFGGPQLTMLTTGTPGVF